jgi:transposase InsO family protein
MDNPFIESFNGRLRDEHLNTELFFSVVDAQRKILEWQQDYNGDRPHSSLGQVPTTIGSFTQVSIKLGQDQDRICGRMKCPPHGLRP